VLRCQAAVFMMEIPLVSNLQPSLLLFDSARQRFEQFSLNGARLPPLNKRFTGLS